jgi:hypothetical protein
MENYKHGPYACDCHEPTLCTAQEWPHFTIGMFKGALLSYFISKFTIFYPCSKRLADQLLSDIR